MLGNSMLNFWEWILNVFIIKNDMYLRYIYMYWGDGYVN